MSLRLPLGRTALLGALALAWEGCGGCGGGATTSCRTPADCRAGLDCIDGVCTASAPDGGNQIGDGGGNPAAKDSDCDAVDDQDETSGAKGCALDPANADTDGDGLPDGVETAAVAPGPDQSCSYLGSAFDADPAFTTNPCLADSDGDGIHDGVEDSNQNGKVDPGELDPNNPADGQGPAGQACSANKLRPVALRQSATPDLHLAVSDGFEAAAGGQLSPIKVGSDERGMMGYHPASKVAFLAFAEPARAGATTPLSDEAAVRSVLTSLGALSNVTTQTFTTWDGHLAAQAFYDQAGTADLIAQANALANALVGAGAGSLSGASGVAGPFKLQAEYVHRSNQAVVVVIALTSLPGFVEPAIFTSGDTAGGSALAAFPDLTGVQCEPFTTRDGKVDFLFSVDDSASMPQEQQALADIATAMAQRLNNSTLDWRIAMVTTSYLAAPLAGSNRSVRRGFTRDINQFKAWLTQNSVCNADAGTCTLVNPAPPCDSNGSDPDGRSGGCWIGAGGTGNVPAEAILGAARKAIDDLSPGTLTEQLDRVRADAQVVVVLVGDADDQTTAYTTSAQACVSGNTCEPVQNFIKFFLATGNTLKLDKNGLGKRIVVHGIACPDGQTCGETQANPRRHFQVVAGTGGVGGNIYDPASIQASMAAILQSVIGAGGHKLQRPPIGASIKVAMGAVQVPASCDKDDLPRSRQDGFDYDGVSRTVSLYGACRPPAAGTKAAVSYRYWIKKAPGGCVPQSCGGSCPAGFACNLANCQCEPDIN
ncbi:MAG: thrombospondin [Myxococcales bacterium]|nr:thrombospondin [Myxococcales bacterium]